MIEFLEKAKALRLDIGDCSDGKAYRFDPNPARVIAIANEAGSRPLPLSHLLIPRFKRRDLPTTRLGPAEAAWDFGGMAWTGYASPEPPRVR